MKTVAKPGLLRSTAVFGGMTFLSRLAGFARDLLQATLFGTGPAVSAFVVAYRIPNYLRRIWLDGFGFLRDTIDSFYLTMAWGMIC